MTILPLSTDVMMTVGHLSRYPSVVLYIGPDQIMPLTSVLGAIVGVALMFWNRLVGLVHKCRSLLSRREEEPRNPSIN